MAKRPTKKKVSPPTLNQLRAKVDRCNRDIVKSLNERAKLAKQIGELKRAKGKPLYDPQREENVLADIVKANKGPLPEQCLRTIFRELMSGSRALAQSLRAAYLGPPYSYSHLAAVERFGQSVELVPVSTIAAVFEEVNRRQAEFGLVPLENSTDGRIADTLGMFSRMPVNICGEVRLRIHHNLLGKCGRSEILEVYSKPQALSQCRDWLARHLPAARTIEMSSTAAAAQLSGEKPRAAAIASRQAAANYGLDIIASNIEDSNNNTTRFAVIGSESGEKTGNDKTALMFQVSHAPGALADAMNIFKRNRLNLTWIESFPIADSANEYIFFVEMEGHQKDLRVRKSVESLGRKALRLELLGSYAQTKPIG